MPLVASGNDTRKASNEEDEHQSEQPAGTLIRSFELLPDEHAPNGSNHGSTLAERIADSRTGRTCANVIEYRAETPDGTTEHTHQMSLSVALEVLAVTYRFTYERLLHHYGIDDDITEEHSNCKDYHACIGCKHSRSRVLEIIDIDTVIDKVVHFCMFLPFPAFSTLAIAGKKPWRALSLSIILGVVAATSIELLQSVLTEYRGTDIWDLVANLTAIVTGSLLTFAFLAVRRK